MAHALGIVGLSVLPKDESHHSLGCANECVGTVTAQPNEVIPFQAICSQVDIQGLEEVLACKYDSVFH